MKKIILIKFGGSLITDKTKTNIARLDVIENLVRQVKSSFAKASEDEVSFIIATGAGGFGHPVAKKYENNLKEGLPFIKDAVKKINNIVVLHFSIISEFLNESLAKVRVFVIKS